MLSDNIRATLERIDALSDKTLFFLIGFPRSGTTWLQRALDGHDQIRCLGEAHFVDILFRNFQTSFQGFNRSIRQQGGTVAHLKEFGGHVSALSYDTQDLHLLLYYSMYIMFDKWVDSPNIRIIGEKTPDNIRALNLLASIFPHARFVHIVRDGRDCAVSGWFFNKSGLDKGKTVAQSFDSYILRFVKQWKSEVEFARQAAKRVKDRYLQLSFEDLIGDPAGQLTGVCRFLGASTNERSVERCIDGARFEALTGGRSTGIEDEASFYRKGIAGDWKNHISPDLAEQVWRIAGDTLTALGYGRD